MRSSDCAAPVRCTVTTRPAGDGGASSEATSTRSVSTPLRAGPVAEGPRDERGEAIVRRIADGNHRRVLRRVHAAVKRGDVGDRQRAQRFLGADRQVPVGVLGIEQLGEDAVGDGRRQIAELDEPVEPQLAHAIEVALDPGAGSAPSRRAAPAPAARTVRASSARGASRRRRSRYRDARRCGRGPRAPRARRDRRCLHRADRR